MRTVTAGFRLEMRAFAACFVAALALFAAGCGSGERQRPLAMFGEVSTERRMEFCQSVAKVMKGFDDLYGKHIAVAAKVESGGKPTVTVHCESDASAKQVEQAVAVAVTNFSLQYPGIGFMVVDGQTWRLIFPSGMMIERQGAFDLHIP